MEAIERNHPKKNLDLSVCLLALNDIEIAHTVSEERVKESDSN